MLGVLVTVLWVGTATAPPLGSDCPSENAVTAELNRLGASAALAALGSPEITVEGTKMRVVLRGLDGAVMGAREVVAPEACQERASVAAVFIAAWAGAWSTKPLPDPSPTNPSSADVPKNARQGNSRLRSRAPENTDVVSRVKPTVVEPSSGPTPAPQGAASPASPMATSAPAPAPTVEIAGLAFGTHDGDAGTFGAGVFAAYRLGKTLSLAALFETTGERETNVGPAIAAYRLSHLGLGASVLRRWGHLLGDVGIFPGLTMLTVRGRQLATSRSVTAWSAVVDLRIRAGLALGRFVPFLFAGASGAPRPEKLNLDNRPETTTLSRWNVSAGAGLAIVLGKNE